MFNFNDVLVFIRVVEAGSFAAAARLLGMPNPTVSRRVAALEREVGTRLLQRTTRSLHMTDAGRLYYEQSSRALQMIEEANLKLAESRSEPSGTLRVTASHGFAAQLLTGATLEFLSRHPKTRIELLLTDERINLIENYVDLAFRAGPLPDSTLIARKLAPLYRLICASPRYLDSRGTPETPADLAQHDCVIAGKSASSTEWVLAGPEGTETVEVSGRFAANEVQTVIAATIAGNGIAQVPHRTAEKLIANGQLRRLLDTYTTPPDGFYAVYPSSRHLSPLVRMFIEHVIEQLKTYEG
ncbi:LysR family transcriptional regulator [Pseudomonas chlororaphis]|uniref:LysR family transcriptional regulator n=1 Tax=Pseudomonas chlororaphis TaxID=587753 RepID=UPI00087AF351|nr:LysR family transcriptional regulator [Pseudomonas chlororaphis]AZD22961.1 Transcriptional regulator, LysR family [Pseudomonas chlororaphis subsp. aurantiaca]AZD55495.1 Transcriptional regulator, LysR family [Pseudomonas chlororaphis subsp. aurantiaca]AZD67839.1 Transcriptional regulator, LysR family [Pseudomonas chlororaphis subsp. aurantiaca]AZD74058.1 Transcriptional regulator, LysR family [Pseudomonas chlororaphis subsp. aurantiaca]QIT23784.1 LysR family transcriptional regulator [Pseud